MNIIFTKLIGQNLTGISKRHKNRKSVSNRQGEKYENQHRDYG
jgi:hypothetical protein